MPVSNLPYTLNWTRSHVYVIESTTTLRTARILILLKNAEEELPQSESLPVARNIEDIYLPASAETRKVYFIPNESYEAKTKDDTAAAVVISSCNSQAATLDSPGTDFHLPQNCPITETQLGRGWDPVETRDDSPNAQRRNRNKASRGLLAKYEKFDK
ncbi:hypothetical protein GGR57DRAFT_420093 [Xylariaceae sp. FL1272]|nr:hypothetical protein GGR57DRAFT_420093 [Xylariaceae sp. FL1272]